MGRLLLEDGVLAGEALLWVLAVVAMASQSGTATGAVAAVALLVYAALRLADRAQEADAAAVDVARSLALAHRLGQPARVAWVALARIVGGLDALRPGVVGVPGLAVAPHGRVEVSPPADPVGVPRAVSERVGQHADWLGRLVARWPAADLAERLGAWALWISETAATRRVVARRMRPRGALRLAWCGFAAAGFMVQYLLISRGGGVPAASEAALIALWFSALVWEARQVHRLRTPSAATLRNVEMIVLPSAAPGAAPGPEGNEILYAVELHRAACLRAELQFRVASVLAQAAPILLAVLHPVLVVETATAAVTAGLH